MSSRMAGSLIAGSDIRGYLRRVTAAREISAKSSEIPAFAPLLAVLAGLRDIVRGALHKTGWASIAAGRRAHLDPISVLALHGIP